MVSPVWFAAMVQVPVVMPVTVLPLTVHTPVVVLLKLTARPDVAVALAVVVPPTARLLGLKPMAPMLWLAAGVTLFEAVEAGLVPALLVA